MILYITVSRLIFICALCIVSNIAQAEVEMELIEDIQVLTNISVDVTAIDISIEESFSNSGNPTWDGSTEKRTIDTTSASSTLGVNVIKGRLNIGMTALISGVEPSNVDGQTVLGGGSMTTNSVDADISRTNYSFLAGYTFYDNWLGYGGYCFSTIQAGSTFTFEDKGIFLGAKYSHRFGASSSLTFNAAYAKLSSSIELKNNSLLNNYQIDGDSDGVSLGATWLYSLDRGRSFYVRITHSIMDFSGSKHGVSPALSTIGDVSVNAEQKYTTFSLGMGF